VLDTKYSNDYSVDQLSNQVGAILSYKTLKATLSAGTKATNVDYSQTDEYTGIVYKRSFINWNPQAFYQYRFSQQKSFRVSYNGNTTQPTLDQLQPIRVNTDPLNITLGNPALKPSYRSGFNASYSSYKVLTDQFISFYGSFNFTGNAIVGNSVTDPKTGKSTFQSVNLINYTPYSYNLESYLGEKIKWGGINAGVNLRTNSNISYSYINSVLNTTANHSYSARLTFSKYVQKKFDFEIDAGPGYTLSGSSLQPQVNDNGYTFQANSYFTVYLPGKIQIAGNEDYQYRGKTKSFNETFSQVLINTAISKTFLKQDNLKLAFNVNDLLNQNQGFTRNASGSNITQTTYNTIKRYFMFTITWDFSQMGGSTPAKK